MAPSFFSFLLISIAITGMVDLEEGVFFSHSTINEIQDTKITSSLVQDPEQDPIVLSFDPLDPLGIGYGGDFRDRWNEFWDDPLGDLSVGDFFTSLWDFLITGVQGLILSGLQLIANGIQELVLAHNIFIVAVIFQNNGATVDRETGEITAMTPEGNWIVQSVKLILATLYILCLFFAIRIYTFVLDVVPAI